MGLLCADHVTGEEDLWFMKLVLLGGTKGSVGEHKMRRCMGTSRIWQSIILWYEDMHRSEMRICAT